MAGFSTSRTIPLEELGDLLRQAALDPAVLNFEWSLRNISFLLGQEAKKCFDQSRDPDGRPWKPLNRRRSGKRNRGRKGLNAKPLRDTDTLMGSMVGAAEGFTGPVLAIREITRTRLRQGTAVFYGIFHQGGTKNRDGSVRIPIRAFAGINDNTATKAARFVGEDVARMISGRHLT